MEPKITLGICVRNCEGLIKNAIQSILEQDFDHDSMQLIFVDDGSTDRTLSVIKESVSKLDMTTTIIPVSWKGIGHARNLVVSKTEDDYVLWVDGDMVLSKGFVKTLVDFMKSHDDAAIVKGKQSLNSGLNMISTLEAYSRIERHMVNYQSPKSRFRSLGTGGSIYRVEVIRQVGGFDENLRYYGEDWDIELRIRDAGWSLHTVDAEFFDYEQQRLSWSGLWKKYWIRGYYSHYFFHKNSSLVKFYRMIPFAAALGGLLRSHKIYPRTKNKFAFMLPIHSFFKMSAWCVGYVRSHLDSYEPR